MEIEELQRPEDSMLLKESGVSATYMNDLDDIESVLSLQPEKLDLKNIQWAQHSRVFDYNRASIT